MLIKLKISIMEICKASNMICKINKMKNNNQIRDVKQ